MTDTVTHKIRWFVWAGGQKMPRTATMRGLWGYDAECSCGWQSRTGGAVRSYVEGQVRSHKFDVACDAAGYVVQPDGSLKLNPIGPGWWGEG